MSPPRSLPDSAPGEDAFVIAVRSEEKERKRLEAMGIIPGTAVRVLADNGGPVLVAVGESRIALARNLADAVLIS